MSNIIQNVHMPIRWEQCLVCIDICYVLVKHDFKFYFFMPVNITNYSLTCYISFYCFNPYYFHIRTKCVKDDVVGGGAAVAAVAALCC